jgi:anti-sigma28 factor (negative regulator of flagellin synthesis)
MKRKFWNSWTFTGPDDEAGRSHGDTESPQGGLGSERKKNDQPTWLERSFQESLGLALENAMDLSDKRLERVERVKAEIAAGTYRVPTEELAERLIKNMKGDY